MLNTAVKAARKAAAIINRASLDLDLIQVSTKGRRDFVTEVAAELPGGQRVGGGF